MSRWIRFFLMIAIGAAAGMYYGWKINPVEYVDTAPNSLHMAYKTDYVLMVAEAYKVENNLNLAVRRLALLGDDTPVEMVNNALVYATQHSYPPADLLQFQALAEALKTWNPNLEAPAP